MSTPKFPHPSIQEEKKFYKLCWLIQKAQKTLQQGFRLSYSETNKLKFSITHMRKKCVLFNSKFGLYKEIP